MLDNRFQVLRRFSSIFVFHSRFSCFGFFFAKKRFRFSRIVSRIWKSFFFVFRYHYLFNSFLKKTNRFCRISFPLFVVQKSFFTLVKVLRRISCSNFVFHNLFSCFRIWSRFYVVFCMKSRFHIFCRVLKIVIMSFFYLLERQQSPHHVSIVVFCFFFLYSSGVRVSCFKYNVR